MTCAVADLTWLSLGNTVIRCPTLQGKLRSTYTMKLNFICNKAEKMLPHLRGLKHSNSNMA